MTAVEWLTLGGLGMGLFWVVAGVAEAGLLDRAAAGARGAMAHLRGTAARARLWADCFRTDVQFRHAHHRKGTYR